MDIIQFKLLANSGIVVLLCRMIIYNVSVRVEHDITEAWVKWMKDVHIPDLIATGLFVEAKLCQLLEHDDDEAVTFVAQYFCENMDAYNSYISTHATRMREKAFAQFGNKFIAMRTIMEVL